MVRDAGGGLRCRPAVVQRQSTGLLPLCAYTLTGGVGGSVCPCVLCRFLPKAEEDPQKARRRSPRKRQCGYGEFRPILRIKSSVTYYNRNSSVKQDAYSPFSYPLTLAYKQVLQTFVQLFLCKMVEMLPKAIDNC